jgi:hypothetical protein
LRSVVVAAGQSLPVSETHCPYFRLSQIPRARGATHTTHHQTRHPVGRRGTLTRPVSESTVIDLCASGRFDKLESTKGLCVIWDRCSP